MNSKRGYLIIPKLIEQPTWGGHYIASYKGWQNASWAQQKIGQSYELYSQSNLSLATDSQDSSFQPQFDEAPEGSIPVQSLISVHSIDVLGEHAAQRFNSELKTLIKFTQAKGNSFQVHARPDNETEQWRAKPESWFYLEDGLATLGLRDSANIEAYQKASKDIEQYMLSLSKSIKKGEITLEEALEKAKVFIDARDIYQYVNTVNVKKHMVVDLHKGGVHHSWEEDDENYPLGNIVYEVQVDVSDEVSSLRAYDKGKIMKDGSVRPVHTNDYFTFLDTSNEANDPSRIMLIKPTTLDEGDNHVAELLFDTDYYSLHRLMIRNSVFNHHTDTRHRSFHHYFVEDGVIQYKDSMVELTARKGHSLFIPAAVGKYTLTSVNKEAILLKTYV